jgi:hypothetical protein
MMTEQKIQFTANHASMECELCPDVPVDDGVTIETYADGTKYYYQHGKRHRDDGPAVERADGYKSYYQHGKCHRDDGPAIEYASGSKSYYQHGKRHRGDGPAIESANGYKSWWLNGVEVDPF